MGYVVYLQAKAIGQSQICHEKAITYLHKMSTLVYLQAKAICQSWIHDKKARFHLFVQIG